MLLPVNNIAHLIDGAHDLVLIERVSLIHQAGAVAPQDPPGERPASPVDDGNAACTTPGPPTTAAVPAETSAQFAGAALFHAKLAACVLLVGAATTAVLLALGFGELARRLEAGCPACQRGESLKECWPRFKGCTAIVLRDMCLHGSLEDVDFSLTPSLRNLDLWQNKLSGTIPSTIKDDLPELQFLRLSLNHFHGAIPEFSSRIRRLDLTANRFSGPLPSFADSPRLEWLMVRDNFLSGGFPKGLCKSPALSFVDLSHNTLGGPIDACFGELEAFTHFNTGIPQSACSTDAPRANSFTGPVPAGLVGRPMMCIGTSDASSGGCCRNADCGTQFSTGGR